jgi:hypothetical protein
MKLAYAALIALVVAGSPVWAAAATAAPNSSQPIYGFTWTGDASHMVQSTVRSLSPDGRTVTLTNGMMLTAAKNLSTEPLMRDEQITAVYKEDGGQNVLTAFWIEAGPTRA